MLSSSACFVIGSHQRILVVVTRSKRIIHAQVCLDMKIREEMKLIIELYVTNEPVYCRPVVTKLQQGKRVTRRKIDRVAIRLQPLIVAAKLAAIHRLCRIKGNSRTN